MCISAIITIIKFNPIFLSKHHDPLACFITFEKIRDSSSDEFQGWLASFKVIKGACVFLGVRACTLCTASCVPPQRLYFYVTFYSGLGSYCNNFPVSFAPDYVYRIRPVFLYKAFVLYTFHLPCFVWRWCCWWYLCWLNEKKWNGSLKRINTHV